MAAEQKEKGGLVGHLEKALQKPKFYSDLINFICVQLAP
jgi:hypothetical protein